MSIGEKIKKHRNNLNLTQGQLAEEAGISESAIKYYESNRRNPKIETLKKIAQALNIPLSTLVRGEDPFSRDLLSCVQKAYLNKTNDPISKEKLFDILQDKITNERLSQILYDDKNFNVKEIESILSYIKELDKETYDDFLMYEEIRRARILGARITTQRLRPENDLSVGELAKKSKLELSYMERLEKGYLTTKPSRETLDNIARNLGIGASIFDITDKDLENENNSNYVRLPVTDNPKIMLKQKLHEYLKDSLISGECTNQLGDEIMDYIEMRIKHYKK